MPLPTRILTLFLSSVAFAAVLFLAFGSYARKQTVHGYLQPESGISNVFATQQGRVSRVYVSEDSRVEAGQLLATVSAQQFLVGGEDTNDLLLTEVDGLISAANEQVILERQNAVGERERLETQLASYRAEKVRLDKQIALMSNRNEFLSEQVAKAEALFEGHHISEVELQGIKDGFYASLSEAEQLQQLRIQADLRSAETESALDQLPIRLEREISILKSRRAELALRRTELEVRGSYSLKAPVAGRVSGLYVKSGEYVDGSTLLISIVADNSRLQAVLYVPTRAIGFIAKGQDVRLYYDAFPYQRFGLHPGRVATVSSTVRTGSDIPSTAMINEPVYRVTVDLKSQEIRAFGKNHRLQAGMQLRAEIILDRRSLLDWIFQPLYSIKGHL